MDIDLHILIATTQKRWLQHCVRFCLHVLLEHSFFNAKKYPSTLTTDSILPFDSPNAANNEPLPRLVAMEFAFHPNFRDEFQFHTDPAIAIGNSDAKQTKKEQLEKMAGRISQCDHWFWATNGIFVHKFTFCRFSTNESATNFNPRLYNLPLLRPPNPTAHTKFAHNFPRNSFKNTWLRDPLAVTQHHFNFHSIILTIHLPC